MVREKLRRFKLPIIIVIIVLILFVILVISRVIVNNSYSSLEELVGYSQSETLPDVDDPNRLDFIGESDEYGRQRVSKLFNTEDLDIRQKEFLGDNYDYYYSILEYISNRYISCFTDLSENGSEYNYECRQGDFSSDLLEEYGSVRITNTLCPIAFYGNSCVVYADSYPYELGRNLFVVDYSSAYANTDNDSNIDFGTYMSLTVNRDNCLVETYNSFNIYYVRE